jgi:hypothetical protein
MTTNPLDLPEIIKEWRRGDSVRKIARGHGHRDKTILMATKGIRRDPCRCGRPASHPGRCWYRHPEDKRPVWTAECDEIMVQSFATTMMDELSAKLTAVRGMTIRPSQIVSRARYLDLYRSPELISQYRKLGMTGRPMGQKNRNGYPAGVVRVRAAPVSAEKKLAIKKLWKEGHPERVIRAALQVTSRQVKDRVKGVARDPCKCGRPCGHSGRCEANANRDEVTLAAYRHFQESTRVWTEAADSVIRRDYPRKIPVVDVVEALRVELGMIVTERAVMERAAAMKVRRVNRVPKRFKVRPAVTAPTRAMAIFAASNEAEKMNTPAAPRVPFRMMSTRGPDPYAAIRLRQITNASKGRI